MLRHGQTGQLLSPIRIKSGCRNRKIWKSKICRKSVKQAPNSEQATGHGMHCREILFTPRCSSRAEEFLGSVNFSVRLMVAELRGVKTAQFSDWERNQFFPYKTLKTYLPVTSLQSRSYIAEWLRFVRVVVEGPKGCLSAAEFSCDSGRGAGDTQTCPNFLLWQMAIPIQNATARRVRSGPNMSENAQFCGRM